MSTKNRVFSVLLIAATMSAASVARAELLFLDNYSTTAVSSDRQSGSAVNSSGSFVGIDYAKSGYLLFNDSNYQGVMLSFDGGRGCPNYDFGAVTDVVVSATICPHVGSTTTGNFGALGLMGQDNSPSASDYVESSDVGVSMFINAKGGWQLFVKGKNALTGSVTAASSYDVALEVAKTDTAGAYTVNLWVGGTEVVTGYSATGLDAYASTNYVGVGTNGSGAITTWDNLTVTRVPEPSTCAMLAVGLISLVAYAWRKRR